MNIRIDAVWWILTQSSFFENLKIIKTHCTTYLKWKKDADSSMIRELAFILSKKEQNSDFIFFWGNQYIFKKISLLFIFSASCAIACSALVKCCYVMPMYSTLISLQTSRMITKFLVMTILFTGLLYFFSCHVTSLINQTWHPHSNFLKRKLAELNLNDLSFLYHLGELRQRPNRFLFLLLFFFCSLPILLQLILLFMMMMLNRYCS